MRISFVARAEEGQWGYTRWTAHLSRACDNAKQPGARHWPLVAFPAPMRHTVQARRDCEKTHGRVDNRKSRPRIERAALCLIRLIHAPAHSHVSD